MEAFILLVIIVVLILVIIGSKQPKKTYPLTTPSERKVTATNELPAIAEGVEPDYAISNNANQTMTVMETEESKRATELLNSLLGNIKVYVGPSTCNESQKDSSVIDISGESYKIPYSTSADPNFVPWLHFYVYSLNDLDRATSEQKKFYYHFKNSFLSGQYLDLFGNNNYAFILLFDFLNEFSEKSKVNELEKHLKVLAQHYPRTRLYCKNFLVTRLRELGDYQGVIRIDQEPCFLNYSLDNQFGYQPLGEKYREELNLTQEQKTLVNKLSNPFNNFCNIEFCLVQTIRLFLFVVDEFNSLFEKENSSLDKELEAMLPKELSKSSNYQTQSFYYHYTLESSKSDVYKLLFKHCENKLREYYGHKRKINTDIPYTILKSKDDLQEKILSKLESIFSTVKSRIAKPDQKTELELNAQNTSRWKTELEKIKSRFPDNKENKYYKAIVDLGNLNEKNPSAENIFFEASKFIASDDRQCAVALYMHYLHCDLKSTTFDNKQLTKTVQKNLFKNKQELHDFEMIIGQLIKDKDLEKALNAVVQIYIPKRRQIQLSTAVIMEVHQKHNATVNLLDELLNDEYQDESTIIKTEQINNEQVKIEISSKSNTTLAEAESPDDLSSIQKDLLELFYKKSYTISNEELESFAKSKGLFKNQLVESINEICYEQLDDVLIEEEDDNYIINEQYFEKINS